MKCADRRTQTASTVLQSCSNQLETSNINLNITSQDPITVNLNLYRRLWDFPNIKHQVLTYAVQSQNSVWLFNPTSINFFFVTMASNLNYHNGSSTANASVPYGLRNAGRNC